MSPQRYIFRKQRQWYSSPMAVFLLLSAIISGLFVTQGYRRGEIEPLFLPTSTPTRMARSFTGEAETHFQAGNLDAAIDAYRRSIEVDPTNGLLYAELARILTFSTETQITTEEKQARFDEALAAADMAVQLAPEESMAHAARAFALEWYSGFLRYILGDEERGEEALTNADLAISRAVVLDESNVLAQVIRAEINIDQSRWDQAYSAIQFALEREPDLWDAHRVYGQLLEYQGYYTESIEEYKKAVELAPNMAFLYIKLAQSIRSLGWKANSTAVAEKYFEEAIEYFAKAVALNEQLGIKDPLPYLGIGRTYAQMGQFFAASQNMDKALSYNPYNQDVYAQLGMVYRQARNYEDAISALKCAVRGCNAEETCTLRGCDPDTDPPIVISGMPLNNLTVVYYYTYASLLAAMYLPNHPERSGYCTDAMDLIEEIRASTWGREQVILDILAESEAICRNAGAPGFAPTSTPTLDPNATAEPAGARSPTPTPSPQPTNTRTPIPTATMFPSPQAPGQY